jgi:hypothetical protein
MSVSFSLGICLSNTQASKMLKKRGWGSWDDPLACATRGLRRMGRVAWSSSCSRNAHDQNVLVRRAHSRIDQATLEIEMGNWEDARSGGLIRAILWIP